MFAPAPLVRILLLVVAVLFLWALFAGEGGAGGPERHYRVKPGDTLWSIAASRYAGDTRSAVWEIARRNGLHDGSIRAGQRLVLP